MHPLSIQEPSYSSPVILNSIYCQSYVNPLNNCQYFYWYSPSFESPTTFIPSQIHSQLFTNDASANNSLQDITYIPTFEKSESSSKNDQIISLEKQSIITLKKEGKRQKREPSKKQKFGRNITSNIFQMIVKYIKRNKKRYQIIKKIIQKHELKINVAEFLRIFKKQTSNMGVYIASEKILRFWGSPQSLPQTSIKEQRQAQFRKIFRIIGKHYLHNWHLSYVYNSLKTKSASKKMHAEEMRKILEP